MGNGRRRLDVGKPCDRAARRGPAPAPRGRSEQARAGRSLRCRAGLTAATLGCAAALAACGGGGDGDLVALDRVGKEDAKNSFSLEMNAGFSPQASTPSHATGFTALYERWARKHPDWKIDLTIIPDAAGTENQARLLETARVGRAPDCASVDSFTLPLFINQKVLQPIDQYFTQEEKQAPLAVRARTSSPGPTASSTPGGGRPTCAPYTAAPTSCRKRRGRGTS